MLIIADKKDNLTAFCEESPVMEADISAFAPNDRQLLSILGLDNPLYSLVMPDRKAEPSSLWSRVVLVDESSASQYDAIIEALRKGIALPSFTACLALTGKNFHGQRNRPWSALKGNLHLTLFFTTDLSAAINPIGFVVLPALAAVDAIAKLTRTKLDLGIKWVNDILIGGKKIGGVLTSTQIQGDRIKSAVFGLGLNIAQAPALVFSPFVPAADYLNRHTDVTLPGLFWSYLSTFESRLNELLRSGPAGLLADYRRYSLTLGQKVCIWDEDAPGELPDGTKGAPLGCGIVSSIGDDLSLCVDGRIITKGRISFMRMCEEYGFTCQANHSCA